LVPKGRWFRFDETLRTAFACTALVWLVAPSAYGQWDGNWALQVWSSRLNPGFLLQSRVTSGGCSKPSCLREITQICSSVNILGHDPPCLGGRDAGGWVLWMISPPNPCLEYLHSQGVTIFFWNETQFCTCPRVLKMPFLPPALCCAYREMCTSNRVPVRRLFPAAPLE